MQTSYSTAQPIMNDGLQIPYNSPYTAPQTNQQHQQEIQFHSLPNYERSEQTNVQSPSPYQQQEMFVNQNDIIIQNPEEIITKIDVRPVRKQYYRRINNLTITYLSEGQPLTELELDDRLPFLKKVYGIVLTQLIFTVGLVLISYISQEFRDFQIKYYYLSILAIIACVVIDLVLICYPRQANKVPNNYILLGLFTFFLSYVVSQCCSTAFSRYGQSGADTVLMSSIIYLAMTVGMTVYAFKVKTNFNREAQFAWMLVFGLVAFSILAGFFYNSYISLIQSFFLGSIFALFILLDLNIILDGRTHQYSIDDYIIGAMLIYVDIVLLFLVILILIVGGFSQQD